MEIIKNVDEMKFLYDKLLSYIENIDEIYQSLQESIENYDNLRNKK